MIPISKPKLAFILIIVLKMTNTEEHVAKYQPELDNFDIEPYLNNPRLLNLEVKCLLYDGPCDIIGRFIKPRMAKGLLGECFLCTPKQTKMFRRLVTWVQENRPDLYRLSITKYLQNSGIKLSHDETSDLKKLELKEGLSQ